MRWCVIHGRTRCVEGLRLLYSGLIAARCIDWPLSSPPISALNGTNSEFRHPRGKIDRVLGTYEAACNSRPSRVSSPVCNSRPSRVRSWWYSEMLVRRHISSPINRISGLGVRYGIVEPCSSWRNIWSCLAPVVSGGLWFIWVALAFLCSTGMASLPVLSLVPCSVCGSFEIHESREESGYYSNNKIRTKREIAAIHHAFQASLWHKYRVWIRQFSQIFEI